MVIGPAKATGPAHSKHEAMSRMDQQPLPLPCEMAPSVTSMTRGTVTGSIRPASVGHANQAGSQSESRLQGGHSTVWRPHTQAALQPSIPTPIGAVISGPATSNHPVHTSRVAPIWSSIDLPKGEAVRRTHSASEAHVLTTPAAVCEQSQQCLKLRGHHPAAGEAPRQGERESHTSGTQPFGWVDTCNERRSSATTSEAHAH